MQVLFLPCQPGRQMSEASTAFVVSSSDVKRGSTVILNLIQPLCILQSQTAKRSIIRRQCLWNVQYVLVVRASFVIQLLASPAQSLLLKKVVNFSLVFLSSLILTCRISQSQLHQVCQTWLQRSRARCKNEWSPTHSVAVSECQHFLMFKWIFWFKNDKPPLGHLNSLYVDQQPDLFLFIVFKSDYDTCISSV